MQQRLIVVDLDGTALSSENEIAPLTKKYLIEAQNQGHYVTIATGRQFYSSQFVYDELGLTLPCLSLNGAIINHPNGDFEVLDHIGADNIRTILNHPIYKEKIELTMLEAPNRAIMDKPDKLMIHFLEHQMPGNTGALYDIVDSFTDEHIAQVPTIYMFASLENGPEALATFQALNLDGVSFRPSLGPSFLIEVYSTHTNKATGLDLIAKKYNIDPSQIIAFGDQINDLEMLEYAATGVAMQNGHDDVKKIADQVTEHSNAESGVGQHLAKILNL